MDYKILPSILSADLVKLGEEVNAVLQAGADMIHVDVMDHHYVPNLTFGPILCQALHEAYPHVPLDVHLMVTPVTALIQSFIKAGASRISIHADATIHLDQDLCDIQKHGCKAGLAINPAQSIDCIQWCRQRLDFVLIMTVNPGFGGQSLIPEVIKKIALIHQLYPELSICVDGGVNSYNIAQLAQAGATEFVAGSSIFKSTNYTKTIQDMRQALLSPS